MIEFHQWTVDEQRDAMHQRLLIVAPEIGYGIEAESTSDLLHIAAVAVWRSSAAPNAWLLFVAISGTFPSARQLAEFRRLISLSSEGTVMLGALEGALDAASRPGVGVRRIELLTEDVVVDVTFCASNEHNTGIQRVVRRTMPAWRDLGKDHSLITWTHDSSAMRWMTPIEEDRVLNWDDRRFDEDQRAEPKSHDWTQQETILVPWRSHVFLPEVPQPELCRQLACLAESSGNEVSAIGYDAIPLVSAEGQSDAESERFAHYLTVIKHSSAVMGISRSAAGEFDGFSRMLSTQGITGPRVTAVPLAWEAPRVNATPRRGDGAMREKTEAHVVGGDRPLVLCVGSHEPRKNQDAVLNAAKVLFGRGVNFELVFVGGGSAVALHGFDREVAKLRRDGFRVSSYRRLRDDELWSLFAQARLSVFVSLHEGFGLPVAESLSLGVPVLTSDYGSVAEIASLGGCVQVDPRDDDQITDAMERMITDDALIASLRDEATAIQPRTWRSYASDLWESAPFGRGAA